MQLVHGTTFRLNSTGKAIYELAVEGLTAGEVAERLQPVLDVPAARLQHDVGVLIEELVGSGLLVREPA